MANHRGMHVEAPEAMQPQAKTQIDVLEIAEVILVEAADLVECVTPIQGGRGTWRKDLAGNTGPLRSAHPAVGSPSRCSA